ncbi:MAG TPA: sialidase family protein, partial [Pyrinomonadaceae bacterium]|nr:sialidase family protein [Pyrinomonadaceae bacterium]
MKKNNPRTPSKTAVTDARRLFLSNMRGRVAALFILAIALTVTSVAAISIASASSNKTVGSEQNISAAALKTQADPDRRGREEEHEAVQNEGDLKPGVGPQARTVPVLTMANAPEVAPCRDILNQDIIDLVNTSVEDPAEIFEANRRAHPHMIEMPPPTECASELWEAVRNPNRPAVVPDLINSRQYDLGSVYNMDAFAASIGTNTDPSSGVEGYQGENSISINPNNPQQIIAHSNTFFRDTTPQCQHPTGGAALTFGTMALFGSSDGGQTWKYNCAPWHTSVTGGVTSANAYFGSDPALAWDGQGNAYACYMLLSQNAAGSAGASIVVAKSTDVGQTWQQLGAPVVNRINVTTALDDKQMMAIDNTTGQTFSHPGRIYIIWDQGNVERVAYSDNGATWTTVILPSATAAIGGNLVIGADGTVYAIWTRYNVETIVFSKSTDGGATWTAPSVIATLALQSFGSNNLPPAQDQRGINGFGAIDVDRNPASASFGNLYVSFTDFPAGTTSGADLNTYVIRSTNGGTNWSTRVKVNDDNFGASQIFPWLAVDQSDGTVNVSWIDSRIDPLNRKTQAVYARSSDGGVSFEPNILVTDNGASFRNGVNYANENSTDNPTYNGNQYGDYTGIAAFNR